MSNSYGSFGIPGAFPSDDGYEESFPPSTLESVKPPQTSPTNNSHGPTRFCQSCNTDGTNESLQWNLSQSQTTVELFPLRQGSHHRGCLQTQVLAVWNSNAPSLKLTAKTIHLVVVNLPVNLCPYGAQRPMLSVAVLVGSSLGPRYQFQIQQRHHQQASTTLTGQQISKTVNPVQVPPSRPTQMSTSEPPQQNYKHYRPYWSAGVPHMTSYSGAQSCRPTACHCANTTRGWTTVPAASHYQTGCIHSLVDPDSRQIENLVQLRDSVMRLTYEALSLATYAEQMLSYAKTYFDGEGFAVMTELRDRCQKSWLETRALYNSVEKLFGEFTAYKQGQSHRTGSKYTRNTPCCHTALTRRKWTRRKHKNPEVRRYKGLARNGLVESPSAG
ncbi:hypothetical protein DB88DRAFT_519022 [Papiliotrema laurentii]|uniref:Uncharacterized protein n=1 Tax=Papiliotrema laurentii TaxID=5418 RepID=A0AAD9CV71_PAPLA|nr:hypothetical protein DB88DRAFT_519022 [Papiliotrema laurentii]